MVFQILEKTNLWLLILRKTEMLDILWLESNKKHVNSVVLNWNKKAENNSYFYVLFKGAEQKPVGFSDLCN